MYYQIKISPTDFNKLNVIVAPDRPLYAGQSNYSTQIVEWEESKITYPVVKRLDAVIKRELVKYYVDGVHWYTKKGILRWARPGSFAFTEISPDEKVYVKYKDATTALINGIVLHKVSPYFYFLIKINILLNKLWIF